MTDGSSASETAPEPRDEAGEAVGEQEHDEDHRGTEDDVAAVLRADHRHARRDLGQEAYESGARENSFGFAKPFVASTNSDPATPA